MNLTDIIEIALGILMILFAIIALETRKTITAIIGLSLISLLAVVAFVLMRAPDVAITEAVIGSGLVTALFVFTLFAGKSEGDLK
ncbi:MAG: hydrogenase subunit MbhD domain-containing protein [Bacillota bacterium]|nr:hydrogenase subunit MbhD domain-containing protein [Bacillota bacterium]